MKEGWRARRARCEMGESENENERLGVEAGRGCTIRRFRRATAYRAHPRLRFFFRPSPFLCLPSPCVDTILIVYQEEHPRPSLPYSSALCSLEKAADVGEGRNTASTVLPGAHISYPCTWTPVDTSITLLSYVRPCILRRSLLFPSPLLLRANEPRIWGVSGVGRLDRQRHDDRVGQLAVATTTFWTIFWIGISWGHFWNCHTCKVRTD